MSEYIEFDKYNLKIISGKETREEEEKILFDKFADFLKGKTKKQLHHILEYGIGLGVMEDLMNDDELNEDLNNL